MVVFMVVVVFGWEVEEEEVVVVVVLFELRRLDMFMDFFFCFGEVLVWVLFDGFWGRCGGGWLFMYVDVGM